MSKTAKNPFNTPEGYFDSFQERLLARLSEPTSELPKSNGYKVPEAYFENIQQQLKQTIEHKESKVVRLYPVKKILGWVASVAAIVLVFFGYYSTTNQKIDFSGLTHNDIEAYFENSEFYLTSSEIAEELSLDDIEVVDILDTNIKSQNIENYLNENLDLEDLNTIYND